MDRKSLIVGVALVIILFGSSWLWRRYRDNDIKEHSKYAIGKITKLLGSLKNGNQFYVDFYYKNELFTGYRSSHIDYDVNIGDYFLVNFSSDDPSHNKILYDYKVRDPLVAADYTRTVWDTIPRFLLKSGRKDSVNY